MQNRLSSDHWHKSLESSQTVCLRTETENKTFVLEAPQDQNFVDEDITDWQGPSEWVSRALTSHSTLYRSFRRRFLQARWPNQQCQVGTQLASVYCPANDCSRNRPKYWPSVVFWPLFVQGHVTRTLSHVECSNWPSCALQMSMQRLLQLEHSTQNNMAINGDNVYHSVYYTTLLKQFLVKTILFSLY